MLVLSRITAMISIALKRLIARRGLTIATLLGLVTAISLTVSIPIYSNAVYNRILLEELSNDSENGPKRGAPFSLVFSFIGSASENKDWEDIQAEDFYLGGPAGGLIGLPVKWTTRFFKTDKFQLFTQNESAYGEVKFLEWIDLGMMSGIEKHIHLVDGTLPHSISGLSDQPLEVLMSTALADQLGVQVGETYDAYSRSENAGNAQTVQFPIRIIGIWTPTNVDEPFWAVDPADLEKTLLISQETFIQRVSPSMKGEIYLASWVLAFDGSGVQASEALPLLGRLQEVRIEASKLLPRLFLLSSPEEALSKYQQVATRLTYMLYLFNLPILGLLLVFIGLVVGLGVEQQQNEIAVLRSRGGSLIQITGIATLEAFLLGMLALLLSLPAAAGIASLMGQTRSFLDFHTASKLDAVITPSAWQVGFLVLGVAILAQVVPSFIAARHTIVSYKQERARTLRPPWWQRAWLDLFLLIPAVYGMFMVRQVGNITLPVGGLTLTHDPFQNPLLFLVPALGIFAMTLLIIRLMPLLMQALTWAAAKTSSVGFLMAARHLARTPGFYTAPMVLLVLTVSLSTFSASLAKTLDRRLHDETYYQIGSDANLSDRGEAIGGVLPSGNTIAGSQEQTRWLFLPVIDYLNLPHVNAAARVGTFTVNIPLGSRGELATLIGIDRVDFRNVVYWRKDFSPMSPGTLMNLLGTEPAGVLVSQNVLQQGFHIGDLLQVKVVTGDARPDLDMKIVGVFDYFPTWYPTQERPYLLVGNLDYIFEQSGYEVPYSVWLKTDASLNTETFNQAALSAGFNILDLHDASTIIAREQARPERQGVFGVLSVGFIAGAFLTVLGFMIYALFSFQSRYIELGILRAVGLSIGQMTALLAWELVFLLLVGMAAGSVLGIGVSRLFIPYLKVASDVESQFLPYQVIVAWNEIYRIFMLFGLLFIGALSALVVLLMRIKIFQAVKLGETT